MLDKNKVVIDMDIGDDIDDVIALYAAMRQKIDIVGITTVFGNTAERARQAKKMLMEYGCGYESVPVYAGHGVPFGAEKRSLTHIPHYTSELDMDMYAPNGEDADDAVDFIIDACYKYGKNLSVIAIGAFTNIARVIEKDENALNSAANVIIMGGAYYKQYADWNVMCDVTAADIMFKNLNNLECIGADVTHLTVGESRLYENLLNYDGKEKGHLYLTELCKLWRENRPKARLLLHDPLVIYYFADNGILTMKPVSIAVINEGYAKGMTLNVEAYGKKKFNKQAYAGFDDTRRALVVAHVDINKFNSRIRDDFNV